MDFQQSFYFLGTFFMGLGIVILIMTIYLILKVDRQVRNFKADLNAKVSAFLDYKTSFKTILHFFDWFISKKRKK